MELFVKKCCPVILHKWLLSRYLGICFWISEPVLVQTIVFRVWVLDLQPISEMYALGSLVGPSDEIRLYANWTYTEYGTKTRIAPTEATGIYSLVFRICAEYELETFGATCDEIRLMAFYLNPDFIDISLKTEFRQVMNLV